MLLNSCLHNLSLEKSRYGKETTGVKLNNHRCILVIGTFQYDSLFTQKALPIPTSSQNRNFL
jgi:hypothetical protein